MNHRESVEALVQNVCVEGVVPSNEVQQHVTNCRSCLDTLALVSELIKPGSSLTWYESIKQYYICDEIENELDVIVTKTPHELATESPVVFAHLSECALCTERYTSAQGLLEAESEGVLGPAIKLTEHKSALWAEARDNVFELTRALSATLRADLLGFKPFDPGILPGLVVAEPLEAVRSMQDSAADSVVQEAVIELKPPTISDKLTVRLLYEAEGLVTIEFSNGRYSSERLVLALFRAGENSSLIEARSLSDTQTVVRFDRLSIDEYFIEIRGDSGVSKLPLKLQKESG